MSKMTKTTNRRKNKQAYMVIHFIALGFVCCVVYLGWLQLVRGEELSARANESSNILRELQSPRGSICDRDGKELAVSLISLSFFVDPLAMDDNRNMAGQRDPRQLAAKLLAEPLNKSEQALYEIFCEDTHFVWLERTMDKARTDRIQAILRDNKLNGFGFIKESKRYYPLGTLAAQVLGFVGTDDKGLSGMEMTFDSVLKSAVQTQFIETDNNGRPIFSSVMESKVAKKMASVHITLDDRFQFAAEKALLRVVENTGAKMAAALVMDIRTGEILAMANVPTFDPNYFYNYKPESWTNANISVVYEPGSTFKPLVAAAAINEGLVEPQTLMYDYGKIKVGDREIKNSDGRAAGAVSFNQVITKSLNTNMVEIGLALGKRRMNEYAQAFGFGDYTDIELPGEEKGILFETDKMIPVDVASMSIGQGIAVTPLQLVCAVSAIGNDGKPVSPQIVKKIVRPDGSIQKEAEQILQKEVMSKETSKKVLAMMENVVLHGGGTLAQIPGYRVAGKTGTAEKLRSGGGYAQNEYIASFIGIAPVEEPRFIVLVLVDTPHSVYYGSQVAAPVFKEIMQQTLVISGVEPSSPIEAMLPKTQTTQKADSNKRAIGSYLHGNSTVVPDLSGYTMRECAKVLEQNGLSLIPEGSGTAFKQEPEVFSIVEEKAIVKVWFK